MEMYEKVWNLCECKCEVHGIMGKYHFSKGCLDNPKSACVAMDPKWEKESWMQTLCKTI